MGYLKTFLQQPVNTKRILVISLCFFFSFGTDVFTPLVNADSTRGVSVQERVDYLFSLNNIEVIDARNTESTYPTWAKMDPELAKTDLSYWVHDVLPFAQDRKASAYIVYPKAGIVVPVLTPSQSDADLIRAGKAFNHYPYLEEGALHYFGMSPSRGAGNMSIAAHSSYLKQDPGRYKTVFQALPITNIGDTIWYFEKNKEGKFDRYEYEITQSFETDKYNVSILNYANDGKSYITTYGCYPIGSNEDRWVNKGLLKGVTKNHSSLDAVAKPSVEPGLSLPLDIDFGVDPSPSPIQLIGLNALDAANAKKAQTLSVGTTVSKPSTVPNPQDIAARIAAAQGKSETMLGAAPIVDQDTTSLETGLDDGVKNEDIKKVVRVRKPRPTREVAVADVVREPLVPTKTLSIDTKDTTKIMRHTIVQSTKITAGDVVEVPTQTNPILASNACYTPKSASVIALGDKTKTRDLVAYQGLMHAYGLTSFTDTDSFLPENGLKRYEAAKILVNIAKNVLCRQPKDTYREGMYKDIAGVDPTLVPYIKEAYEYGIMKGGKGKFRPLDRITRQEFVAGLMRIFLNTYLTESTGNDWYANYEQVFADYGLNSLLFDRNSITRFDISKVFYMIYYSDAYQSSDAGYVLPSTVE